MNFIDFVIIPLQIFVFFYTLKKILILRGFLKDRQKSLSLHDYKVPVRDLLRATPQKVMSNKQYADFSRYKKYTRKRKKEGVDVAEQTTMDTEPYVSKKTRRKVKIDSELPIE